MGKWQTEEEINAALRELAREVRALRTNLRGTTAKTGWPDRLQSANDRPAPETEAATDDERSRRPRSVDRTAGSKDESSKS